MRIGRILVVGLAFVAATAPTTAIAEPKEPGPVLTRSDEASGTGLGTIVTATATCPRKARVLSGGFNTERPGAAQVYESRRADARSWVVSEQITSSSAEPVSLTAYAYCRKRAPKVVEGSSTVLTPASPVPLRGPPTIASCDKPTVTGGGFQTPPPLAPNGLRTQVIESRWSNQKAWEAEVVTGTGGQSSLTSFAYCARGPGPKLITATGNPIGPGTTISGSHTTCRAGTIAVGGAGRIAAGGGFSQSLLGPIENGVTAVYKSVRVAGLRKKGKRERGSGWSNLALYTGNFPPAPAITLDTTLVCR